MTDNTQTICITCGMQSAKLYTRYKGDIIKIAHCSKCDNVVDKYIEYDLMIISLDAMLLKRPAFRHILVNSGIKAYWKFCLVLLICDAITKLLCQRTTDNQTKWLPDHVIYSALEVDLYWNFFLAVIELFALLAGIMTFISVWNWFVKGDLCPSYRRATCGILLSNFGKILVIPAIMWGQKYSTISLWLCNVFTVASNIQAARVLYPSWNPMILVAAVLFGHFWVYLVYLWIPQDLVDT